MFPANGLAHGTVHDVLPPLLDASDDECDEPDPEDVD